MTVRRSRLLSTAGGMLLVTSSIYLMLYALDPFDLGDEFRSPTGAVLCTLGVAAAAGLIAASIVERRAERRARKAAPPPGR
jgi:cytochrome c-type biogenesis protein CcmE